MDYSNTHSVAATPVRSGSPDLVTEAPLGQNPFMSPFSTRPNSTPASSSAVDLNQQVLSQRYFHSRRIKKGEVEKPWLDKKDPREKWVTIIPIIGIVIGLGIAGFLVWDGMRTVVNHEYCPVLTEDWKNGIDPKIWTKEVELGGFGYVVGIRNGTELGANHRIVMAGSSKRRPARRISKSTPTACTSFPRCRTRSSSNPTPSST